MSVIFILLPLALLGAAAAVTAFVWATRDGQFDHLEQEAWRPLMPEKEPSNVSNVPVNPRSEALPCAQTTRDTPHIAR